ncbi:MAG: aminotransferase [Gammaproteobacteria bacterium RIFCSPHIGHO2_12_FULL_41_20]|nr:MAG: aminotransferase [Gammaproteobacteria bacterium RIFCSPHIGHO2_12_FULL_41_20]
MLFGLLDLPWWGYIVVTLVLTQITIASVTLYLHRCQAHRALELHPLVSHFFRFWLWLTTGMVTKEWAAIHRKHHAKVETAEDPHSPQVKGIGKVFFEGAELYKEAVAQKDIMERYGHGTPDDWVERHVYAAHNSLGITLMLLIDLALFGIAGVIVWAVQMAWIPLFAAGVVNGIGHYWGYRNFESPDASRNLVPFGIFIGGEELHNNHHTYASSAKFSVKWWEIDIGWYWIRFLQVFGLAKPKRVPPRLQVLASKTGIDTETLKAVVINRFQVMANYTKAVILPALKEEKKRAGVMGLGLLKQARVLLTREISLLKLPHQAHLAEVLQQFQSLKVVYDFRLKLQAIWSRSTATQKELVDALHDWCKQAEATGIDVLLKFSRHLKTYVTQETQIADPVY